MEYFSQQSIAPNMSRQQLQKKYLAFMLGNKLYAISVLKIKEILEYDTVTPIPRMPRFICGAINLRGQIIPIVDLMEQLDIGEHTVTSRSCIVIIMVNYNGDNITAGVLVDSVSKVIDFDEGDIDKAPDLGGQLNTEFIEGMGKSGNDFMIILDVDRVFSMEQIMSLSGVEQDETEEDSEETPQLDNTSTDPVEPAQADETTETIAMAVDDSNTIDNDAQIDDVETDVDEAEIKDKDKDHIR